MISCKPKFDPNLEFIPTDVIYGSVSSDNAVNTFRVYAGFSADEFNSEGLVNDSNAIYHNDSMEFQIVEFDYNHEQTKSKYLSKFANNDLKSQVFNFNHNVFYQFDSSEFSITDGYYYKIRLENLKTNKVSYSEIQAISDFTIEKPTSGYNPGSLIGKDGFKNRSVKVSSKWDYEFISKIDLMLIIEKREIWQIGGSRVGLDTLIFPITEKHHKGFGIPTHFTFKLDSEKLLNFINENLSPIESDNYWRRFDLVRYDITNFSKEMKEYIEAEQAFNSLAQDKPVYSNILNEEDDSPELGLFFSHKKNSKSIVFDDSTMAFLDTSAIYKHLGF